nr:PREDICTED: unconventional myosin-Ia isoform X2 [Bemisia tabaci]
METQDQEVGAWDAVLLDPLTEEDFISNLHQRYKRDHIYTYIGNFLVSLNPYKELPIYSAELACLYRHKGPYQLPPHIFAIAGSAWRWLRDRGEDQVIVLTGESGSGKTEAARMTTLFVAAVSEKESFRHKLTSSSLILEGFGNAKTMLNDNASRFGEYLEVEFNHCGEPVGGTITNYLLEKSRVTQHAQGERNFHIFYQLLTGADIQLLKLLKIQRNVESYSLLRCSKNCFTECHLEHINDKSDFLTTKRAMENLGLSSEEIVSILRIVASVLKLGNLVFIPSNSIDGTETCTISNDYELHEVCELLNADSTLLQTAITSRSYSDGIQFMLADLCATEATHSRDSLCKALYSRLFTFLVNRINDFLKVKPCGKQKVLGVLDVYGFEIMERNGFEQFIINFCNEKLHQVVMDQTLREEQEEYIREGIDWVPVQFFNNSPICDLIEKNNYGLLSLLDEECGKPESLISDEQFLAKIVALSTSSNHCHTTPERRCRSYITTSASSDNNMPSNCFRLRHYAGTVMYDVSGFVEKNNDSLHRDLSLVMYKCQHPLLKLLFPEGNPKRTQLKRPATIATQFRVSLNSLVHNLSSKQAYYVRCIKPNNHKRPRCFDSSLVQHQVRYLGLLETVKVRRSGFCYRLPYLQFLERYKMLCLDTWPNFSGPVVEGVNYILRDLPIPNGEFAFGQNKIFVRSPRSVFELEEFRRQRLEELAILVQKVWRGYHQRRNFLCMKRSQIIIASAWKSWRAKEEYRIMKKRKQMEWAVNVIQRHYIRWKRLQFLLQLSSELPADSDSPISHDWPPCHRRLADTSLLLRRLHHKWRCHKYRLRFDQTARNRMREKVTASIIFKERKASYPRSVGHPFHGDYVRLRQNVQWKKISVESNDQYVVFADIINKIARSSGKFVPILFVLSTSSVLILDKRTLQVKYRVPATEIYRLSLSPFLDDVAVFHIRATSPCSDECSEMTIPLSSSPPGCLFQSELGKKKGDFVFQTGHVIEIVTKLFLVIQNAVGKPPEVNITTEFEANFGQQTVMVTFKCIGLPEVQPGQIRILRKRNKLEVLV